MAKKATEISVVLEDPQPKKHVVRYDSSEDDPAMSSVYISKKAFEALGSPAKVKITIEVA